MSSTKSVVVFTCRGKEQIIREGGSQAWRLDSNRASKYAYVVCVQNTTPSWGTPESEHHQAFLVGRISNVTKSKEGKGVRWIINFESYAEISIPNQWDGNRNPVAYNTLENIGIDIDQLEFKPMPTALPNESKNTSSNEIRPLTLNEAKMGLALKFGVDESDISITINA